MLHFVCKFTFVCVVKYYPIIIAFFGSANLLSHLYTIHYDKIFGKGMSCKTSAGHPHACKMNRVNKVVKFKVAANK